VAALGRLLHHAQQHPQPGGARGGAQRPEVAALDAHRLLGIVGVQALLQRRFEAGPIGQLDPERVARQQRLAEGDQLAAVAAGLRHPADHLGQGGCAVQPDRRDLGQAHLQCA
jgi:hypothetical protein